jgi:hypothetical protein
MAAQSLMRPSLSIHGDPWEAGLSQIPIDDVQLLPLLLSFFHFVSIVLFFSLFPNFNSTQAGGSVRALDIANVMRSSSGALDKIKRGPTKISFFKENELIFEPPII